MYEATITAEEPGSVAITIDTDFNRVRSTLLPIQVVAAGERPAPMALPDRGRHLFVAKGCVTCHRKTDDDFGDRLIVRVGPDLQDRTFDPDWLAQKLENPGQFRTGTNGYDRMPNLRLDAEEIAALVSYINAGAATATSSR